MIQARRLGLFFVTAGAMLIGAYVAPTVYGASMAHLALSQFRAGVNPGSHWDAARLGAYQRTLGVALAPPEAILRVPRLGIAVPILEGTSDLTLNRGVGHILGTPLPGEGGNFAVAGHRDGFFRPLKDVRAGDMIDVERPERGPGERRTDRYEVRRVSIVSPSDRSVLLPTARATLTLVTCYPFYFIGGAPKRYIVQAVLVAPPSSRPLSLN